jgi:hypothetical protein
MASILDTRFFATLLGVWRYKECEKFYAGMRIENIGNKYGSGPHVLWRVWGREVDDRCSPVSGPP